jgi:hypothetical protein
LRRSGRGSSRARSEAKPEHRRGRFLEQARLFRYKLLEVTHRSLFGSFLSSLPLCAVTVAVLGVLRLGHQFPGAAGSPGLLVPFLFPVAGLALEAGGLVALTYSQLAALLRSPLPTVGARARASLPALGLLAAVLVLAETIPRGTEHPGAFANQLLASARDSCTEGAVVPVPLLGLSVRCEAPQRIEGPMPGVPAVHVAMRDLTFSDDLRNARITALELRAVRALSVTLRAGTARIAGIAPWSRSPRLSPVGRFAVLLSLGAALWLLAIAATRSASASASRSEAAASPRVRRLLAWLARALLALPGAAVAGAFVWLEQERAEPSAYAAAGGAAALCLIVVVSALTRRFPQILNSFRDF